MAMRVKCPRCHAVGEIRSERMIFGEWEGLTFHRYIYVTCSNCVRKTTSLGTFKVYLTREQSKQLKRETRQYEKDRTPVGRVVP
jgi:ribosomal protein S27E